MDKLEAAALLKSLEYLLKHNLITLEEYEREKRKVQNDFSKPTNDF